MPCGSFHCGHSKQNGRKRNDGESAFGDRVIRRYRKAFATLESDADSQVAGILTRSPNKGTVVAVQSFHESDMFRRPNLAHSPSGA